MHNIDWKWLIVGILFGVFVIPFIQARLGARGGPQTRNRAA